MNIKETFIPGCYIFEPRVFEDERGYFFESFNEKIFQGITGLDLNFVQDNQSFSTYGVIRALHAQAGEHAQAKLVRVLQGEVLDVAVDARKDSPTYGKHFALELSAENKLQLLIPRGCLHGFVVLSDNAEFFYKCDNYYHKESERGVIYNDPDLSIDWKIPADKRIISKKDAVLPLFSALAESIRIQ